MINIITGLFILLSLFGFGLYITDSGTSIDEIDTNISAFSSISKLNQYYCAGEFIAQHENHDNISNLPQRGDIVNDIEKAFMVCGLQNIRNIQSNIFNAAKLIYLKKWTGALDTAISISSLDNDESPCIKNARIIQAMCPVESANHFTMPEWQKNSATKNTTKNNDDN
jgi:hypothetical protein